jgi:hypothetical protein
MFFGILGTKLFTSISEVWIFILECGAGLGLVLILRWFWWRINAWSEISASIAPFIGYSIGKWVLEPNLGQNFTENKGTYIFTVLFTTITWISITYITKPTNDSTLLKFYNQVKPMGWWRKFAQKHQLPTFKINLWLIITWLSSTIMIYAILFLIGSLLFKSKFEVILYLLILITTAITTLISFKKSDFNW